MLTIINLTPHTIKLNSGKEFPPSGMVARVSAKYGLRVWIENFSGIDVFHRSIPELLKDEIYLYEVNYGEIENLPEPEEDIFYIVSAMVQEAGKKIRRHDLLAPATGHPETVRNEQGQIVSVPGFVI